MPKFKLVLKEGLKAMPQEKLGLLPSGYYKVGDIIIVHLDQGLNKWEKEIGEFVKKELNAKSVFKRGPVSGELRKPRIKRIAGKANVTVHKENGCLYKIDVSRLMFSKGNFFERNRIRPLEGEKVIDMFSGLGYFSIPLAKKNPSCQVYAIEKNPLASKFLKENLELNRISNVQVIEKDCRSVDLKGDRVIMGFFPGTEDYLPKAFSFLGASGTIHYHNIYRKRELWEKPLGILKTKGLENGYRIEKILAKRIVKQYSPCKYHIVVDAKFVRNR